MHKFFLYAITTLAKLKWTQKTSWQVLEKPNENPKCCMRCDIDLRNRFKFSVKYCPFRSVECQKYTSQIYTLDSEPIKHHLQNSVTLENFTVPRSVDPGRGRGAIKILGRVYLPPPKKRAKKHQNVQLDVKFQKIRGPHTGQCAPSSDPFPRSSGASRLARGLRAIRRSPSNKLGLTWYW